MTVKTTTIESGNVTILEPKGSLIGGDETDELKKTVKDLLEGGNRKLVIDLGKVTYVNSTALGVLVASHTSYVNRGGKIALRSVNKNIHNIFVTTKLSLLFDVFDSQMEAVASFSK